MVLFFQGKAFEYLANRCISSHISKHQKFISFAVSSLSIEGSRNMIDEETVPTSDVKHSERSRDEVFMKLALRHAQTAAREREVPIGAVLVDSNQTVLSSGKNSVEVSYDATAHAEIECLRKASKLLGNWRLKDCTLYTTVEPCAMCLSAIQSFRVKRVVFGTKDHRLGACGSWIDLQNIAQHPYHPQLEITGGILEEESKVLLKRFFQNRRVENSEDNEDTWTRGYNFDTH